MRGKILVSISSLPTYGLIVILGKCTLQTRAFGSIIGASVTQHFTSHFETSRRKYERQGRIRWDISEWQNSPASVQQDLSQANGEN